MVNLQQLVEKQKVAKRRFERIRVCFFVVLILFATVFFVNSFLKAEVYVLMLATVILVVTFIACLAMASKLDYITNRITQSISRIFEATIEKEVDLAFIWCSKKAFDNFYFAFEIHDDVITYDALANLVEPFVEQINEIICENVIAYFHIERNEQIALSDEQS
ncbi:MAG: hypothetical protein IJ272_02010 [Clostridia bacterium]|nr:hypothetical protein [Clostridia bacterium]